MLRIYCIHSVNKGELDRMIDIRDLWQPKEVDFLENIYGRKDTYSFLSHF